MADEVPEIFAQQSAAEEEQHSTSPTPQRNDQLLFLTRLRERLDCLNISLPTVEIKFEKLSVEAQAQEPKRVLPNLWNCTLNFIEGLLASCKRLIPHKKMCRVKILDDLSGTIRPSRMVLIVGRPGSGKTTLLRALAGKLEPGINVQGSVTYNGLDVNDSILKQVSAYVSQLDLHQGELTVSETLDFSHRLFGGSTISEILDEISRKERITGTKPDPVIDKFVKDTKVNGRYAITDYITEVLGLSDCAYVSVGDYMRRGISGGEMKRLSIGEMLVGPARAFFMDEISNGLDSFSILKIINFLKEMSHLLNITMVVTLLQPSSEIFELFDDLILLCQGKILYHGPRDMVLDFFQTMGFKCPVRKNVPDFLLEVTSGMHQLQYMDHVNKCIKLVTTQEFCESFKSYSMSRHLPAESQQTTASQSEALVLSSESTNKTKWNMFNASLSRELLLMKRNIPARAFKVIQILLMAFVVSTTFSKGKGGLTLEEDLIRLLGAIYACVVILLFNGMVELTMMILRLPVYYKQRDLQFYPGWAFLLPEVLLHMPVTVFESAIWVSVTYFPVGFAHSPTRFLKVLLACCCIQESSVALTRLIAAVTRTQVMANVIGTGILVSVFVLGGFVISKGMTSLDGGYGVFGFVLPHMLKILWLFIEFLDKRWSMPTVFIGTKVEEIGKAFLKFKGMFSEPYSFWICIGALYGFCILFNILCAIALSYLRAPQKDHVNFAKDPPHGSIQVHALSSTTSPPSMYIHNGTMRRRITLPVRQLTLTFQHINYYVDMPVAMKKYNAENKRLQLLKNVSGAFRPGSLTALMGETGAGKTTLMDVLAGRKTAGFIEGSITVAGYLRKQETFTRVFGYCEQIDIHSPYITVHESLLFSAWLRLPSDIILHTRKIFVDEVMELVELTEFKGALVGIPGVTGLTTDQRRRLSMAVELVSNPSIIFMDEPTTGLDTPAAAIVMKAIRQTADTGRTVVCTIHQPNMEIFQTFDELLLMKRGELIYNGPVGSSGQNIIRYLQGIPGVPRMQNGCNPSTWMLDVTSTKMGLGTHFSDYYHNSSLYEQTMQKIEELSKPLQGSQELAFTSKYAQGIGTQCAACCLKQIWSYWRNPELNLNRIIITIIISLLFGTVFWNIGYKPQEEQDLFNMLGVLYVSALYLGFVNCALVQPIVWFEKVVFNRESSSGMYSAMPYAVSQVAAEIPYVIVQVIIFTFMIYSMVGFQWTIVKFAWFISFVLLGFIYFTLLGMMLVSCTPSLEIAAALSFFFFVMWNLFLGFFIPRMMMRSWTRWYYWLDPAAWTVYGLMVSQLRDRPEIVHMFALPDQTAGDFMKGFLGFRFDLLPQLLALHMVAIFAFLFVFALSIKYLNFQKR